MIISNWGCAEARQVAGCQDRWNLIFNPTLTLTEQQRMFRKQQGDVQVLTDANESPEVEHDLSDSVTPQNIDSNTDVQVLTDTNEPSEVEQDPSDSVSKKHKNHHLQLLINRFIHFVYYYNHLIQ